MELVYINQSCMSFDGFSFRLMKVTYAVTVEAQHFIWLPAVVPWTVSGFCLLGELIDFN